MNEDNNKIVPETADDISKTENTNLESQSVPTENADQSLAAESITANKLPKDEQDISKVKIRSIIKQRYKKSGSFMKMVLPLVLVGIICFGAGLVTGRGISRHQRGNIGGPGMYRQLPKGNFNGGGFNRKQFNNNRNQFNNRNQVPNSQTPKVTPPAATN